MNPRQKVAHSTGMFHSIRWRLVSSYVLLTLITVVALGTIALWATRKYAQQQEAQYLSANAKAVAQQALPLLGQSPAKTALSQLARLASFFGDVHVRILDSQGQLLVDSGELARREEFAWFVFPSGVSGWSPDKLDEGWVLGYIPESRSIHRLDPGSLDIPFMDMLPPGTEITIITRSSEPWGSLFQFQQQADSAGQADNNQPGNPKRSTQVLTYPIQDGKDVLGYIELSSARDFSTEALDTARRGIILAGGFAVLLAGGIGLWMGGRLSKPVVRLTEKSRQMSAGDLAVRADVDSQDEIGELAAQFNQMAGQLQTSFDQLSKERDSLRRFITDASHELRTPITALKNFNDLLIQGADRDDQVRDEFLAESQLQIKRLEWITHNLLDLSRLDAGLVPLETSEQDGLSLLETVYSSFKPVADQSNIDLKIHSAASQPDQPVTFEGDRARLEIALGNLVDNALKYTPQGGSVELGFEKAGELIHFWVEDNGPDIPTQDLPHIFERFYRGSNQKSDGSGLGLAIVHSIVKAHKGVVMAQNLPGGGVRFQIELPA